MTKLVLVIALSISFLSAINGQSIDTLSKKKEWAMDTSFRETVNYFQTRNRYLKQTLQLPVVEISNGFKAVLADSAWHLRKQQHWLENPFSSEKADKYPLSYSIIYQNRLVSLLAPGHFACFMLNSWQRDIDLEQKLNTRRFEQSWLIDGQLLALSSGKYWQFTSEKGWRRYAPKLPFTNRPKLFEDASYLVYNECKGEFGGQVFFYDKQTRKVHWTQSTCTVWVRHTAQGYEILSNLGHMTGFTHKDLVSDPRALPEWKNSSRNIQPNTSGTTRKSLFSFQGLQLFGGFVRHNEPVYLFRLAGRTFLATLNGNTFTIIDPLFNNELYSHDPVSTNYLDTDLINIAHYGTGGSREVMCLIAHGDLVTLLVWR